ncbi:kinesin light chain [Aspergillus bombycis]|uniref:Kinesin light chain n=1 Tax=Aspergillus bombycis TaxID=109264 RepID=A0A1F8ABR6_9EURO|nr:kinesin light chain [Aspergillus bombycis]OGM49154.1 kinesin light chain [Aspergillus bombycis]
MRPKDRRGFNIAIFCALPIEADAVTELFDEIYDHQYGKHPSDTNSYTVGKIWTHNVVLCHMPGMGKVSASSVAAHMKSSYTEVRLALVVGICGGVPVLPSSETPIFLGDVIISNAVVQYDYGRQYPDGIQRRQGVTQTLGRPNQEIRGLQNLLETHRARNNLQNDIIQHLEGLEQSRPIWKYPGNTCDVLFGASNHHKHHRQAASVECLCFNTGTPGQICQEAQRSSCDSLGCDEKGIIRRRPDMHTTTPSVHIGTIASGDMVMKSGEHRDRLANDDSVAGFDMEGAGVWDALPCIIIKGVCDYADSHKDKRWQAYAAATGAASAKAFLRLWNPASNEGTKLKSPHWMVPFGRNFQFVGRQNEIAELERLMIERQGPSKIAISGLGGVGKTHVALELAYRVRERDAECSVFWIPCTSPEIIEQTYMDIAQILGMQDVKPAEAKEQVMAYLRHKDDLKWLLIFDNADDMDMWTKGSNGAPALKDLIPQTDQGRIIFTTRNKKLAVKLASREISIPEVDEETGVKMLETALPGEDLSKDHETAVALLSQLTFLPLAIMQAAAFIKENSISLEDYLTLLQEQEPEVVELLSEDFETEGRYQDVPNPVATTWLVSFQQIQQIDQLAAEYLSFMACVNPRNIPQSLLPPAKSKLKMVKALGLLSAYSFISDQAKDSPLNLHRLVHLATRNWMRRNQQFMRFICKTADRLRDIFPDNNHTNRILWRAYLPHALALLEEDEFKDQQEQYIDLLETVGDCLVSDGRYNEAEALLCDVRDIRQKQNGEAHLSTLTSMSKLASAYFGQGRYTEAKALNIHVLETRNQILGPDHPDTLTTMTGLAAIDRQQGHFTQAEGLIVKVLDSQNRALGSEHPSTLTSTSGLASVYMMQGRYRQAEELFTQTMERMKKVLGPEHPTTLSTTNSLATLFRTWGAKTRLKLAEELEKQMIEVLKKALGPRHPRTLTGMNNLALTYWYQEKWQQAEELGAEVIEAKGQMLGWEHPFTLTSMNNLALTYSQQAKWNQAEELMTQTLESRKKTLGSEHFDTITSMLNLAHIWRQTGRHSDSIRSLAECVRLREKQLGPKHPDTCVPNVFSTIGYVTGLSSLNGSCDTRSRIWTAVISCAYSGPAKGYIESLEHRLHETENVLLKVLAQISDAQLSASIAQGQQDRTRNSNGHLLYPPVPRLGRRGAEYWKRFPLDTPHNVREWQYDCLDQGLEPSTPSISDNNTSLQLSGAEFAEETILEPNNQREPSEYPSSDLSQTELNTKRGENNGVPLSPKTTSPLPPNSSRGPGKPPLPKAIRPIQSDVGPQTRRHAVRAQSETLEGLSITPQEPSFWSGAPPVNFQQQFLW